MEAIRVESAETAGDRSINYVFIWLLTSSLSKQKKKQEENGKWNDKNGEVKEMVSVKEK